jgi:hypothetical protein
MAIKIRKDTPVREDVGLGDGGVPVSSIPAKLISTYTDSETGDVIDVYDDGSEKIRKKGTFALEAANAAKLAAVSPNGFIASNSLATSSSTWLRCEGET